MGSPKWGLKLKKILAAEMSFNCWQQSIEIDSRYSQTFAMKVVHNTARISSQNIKHVIPLMIIFQFASIDHIELWRDNFGISSDWNIDTITVLNTNTGDEAVFPVFRWIRADYRYNFIPLDTSLPQYDERKGRDRLSRKQK